MYLWYIAFKHNIHHSVIILPFNLFNDTLVTFLTANKLLYCT